MEQRTDAEGDAIRPSKRSARWPVLCWLGILTLIGIVQIVRGARFDVAVFASAIVLVLLGKLPAPRFGHAPPTRIVVFTAAGLAAVLSLLPRHSPVMMAGVLAAGAAALVAAWPGTASVRTWTPALRRLAICWAVILVVGCVWELAQFILGRVHPDDPSFALSDLVDPLLGTRLGKAVFVAAWLACGIFLVLSGTGRRRR